MVWKLNIKLDEKLYLSRKFQTSLIPLDFSCTKSKNKLTSQGLYLHQKSNNYCLFFYAYFNSITRLKIYLDNFVDIIVVSLRVDAAVGGIRRGVRGANSGWGVVNHMLHDDSLNMCVTCIAGSGRELGGVGPLHHYWGSASRFITLLLSNTYKLTLLSSNSVKHKTILETKFNKT